MSKVVLNSVYNTKSYGKVRVLQHQENTRREKPKEGEFWVSLFSPPRNTDKIIKLLKSELILPEKSVPTTGAERIARYKEKLKDLGYKEINVMVSPEMQALIEKIKDKYELKSIQDAINKMYELIEFDT